MKKTSLIICLSILVAACSNSPTSEVNTTDSKTVESNQNKLDELTATSETAVNEKLEDSVIVNNRDLSPQFTQFVVSDYPFDVVDAYIADDSGEPTNIRATPGGEVITQLVEGDYMLKIVDKKDRWFKIEYIDTPDNSIVFGNKDGWIHGSVVGFGTRNYGGQALNIYSKASDKSNKVDTFNDEKEVKLLDYIDNEGTVDWVKVEYNSNGKTIKGWMKREMLCGNPLTTCS